MVVGRSLLINRSYFYFLKIPRSVKGLLLKTIRPFFLKNGDHRSIGNIGRKNLYHCLCFGRGRLFFFFVRSDSSSVISSDFK